MTGTEFMPSFKGFIEYDKAGGAMLTAANGGQRGALRLECLRESHRSREFDEVALLSFAWRVPRPFRDGIPPVLPLPSIASVTPARLIFGCVSELFAQATTRYAPSNASRRRLKTSPLA
jgi:hypothetical protein